MEHSQRSWLSRLLARAPYAHGTSVGLPVAMVLTATVVVFANVQRAEHDRLIADFKARTANVSNGLRTRFDVYQETVESISSLYATGVKLDRERFKAFVARTISQYDGIQALGWDPLIRHDERAAFEKAVRDSDQTNFQFLKWTPDGDSQWTTSDSWWADEYVPVWLLEPFDENKSAYGIDVASNPTRREALERARDTGRAVATARITLAQDTGKQAGYLIFVPVYAVGASTETIIDRRANLKGFAVGVFRVGDIVNQTLADLGSGNINVRITDLSAESAQRLLFETDSEQEQSDEAEADSRLVTTFDYEVGSRRWSFEFTATQEYLDARRRWGAWLLLGGGIGSSILLGGVLHLVIGRAREVEQQVSLKTEQLREANAMLEREALDRELAQTELQAQALELGKSNEHLTRFNQSATGRELRMVELKKEINDLLESTGQSPRYEVSFGKE